jgi:hypothetical protein
MSPTPSSLRSPRNTSGIGDHAKDFDLEEEDQLQAEVEKWENKNKLYNKILELQRESGRLEKQLTYKRKRSASNSPERHGEIKMKDVPLFTTEFNLQQREEWLSDIHRIIDGAPWKYSTDSKKILAGLGNMDRTCRQRWDRFMNEKLLIQSRAEVERWSTFENYTLSLIRNSLSFQTDTMSQMEHARQRSDQDPRDFDAYLDTLEQHFDRESEEKRANFFFSKLQFELRQKMRLNILNLPKTRDEMVALASHYWDLIGRRKRPKTNDRGNSSDQTSKKSERNYHQHQTNNISNSNHPRQVDRNTSSDKYCYNCGDPAHFANTCPKPKRSNYREQRATPKKNPAHTTQIHKTLACQSYESTPNQSENDTESE